MGCQMSFDPQFIYILFGLIIAIFGWFFRQIISNIEQLKSADVKLSDRFYQLELLVSGEYIKRSEFKGLLEAVFSKLDKISEKLDTKQDRN